MVGSRSTTSGANAGRRKFSTAAEPGAASKSLAILNNEPGLGFALEVQPLSELALKVKLLVEILIASVAFGVLHMAQLGV
jgi:hypothetical protein